MTSSPLHLCYVSVFYIVHQDFLIFGKIDSIVNDNGVMASKGDFIYGRVASRETAVEAVMNQSCFLVHFVVRARSFPKINTF
jgi:hypothetical protein